jgi:hypothetical protein
MHNIDDVISSGTYDLAGPPGGLHKDGEEPLEPGEPFSYRVVTVDGPVAADLSIPVTVEMRLPDRFAGRRVVATLIPHGRSEGETADILKDLGLGSI